MKHKFVSDLGIDVDPEMKELMQEMGLNGLLDQSSDNVIVDQVLTIPNQVILENQNGINQNTQV